jgi:hypothetical protein
MLLKISQCVGCRVQVVGDNRLWLVTNNVKGRKWLLVWDTDNRQQWVDGDQLCTFA